MTSKKKITKQEKEEFIRSMAEDNATSIHDNDAYEQKQDEPLTPEEFASSYNTNIDNDWHDGNDELHFARSGMAHKILKKLKQGEITISAVLDLHGKTVPEAALLLERLILSRQCAKQTCLLVIHGKGNQSVDGKAILKNKVANWLKQDNRVLAFHSAQPRDGGRGALYVLIKRKNR